MKRLAVALLLATPALAKDRTPAAPPPPPLPASVDGLPIGAIAPQQLPTKGCAAFLWTRGPSHALVAMVVADPAALRLSIDGRTQDLARTAQHGDGGFGFARNSEYRDGAVTATLDLGITSVPDMTGGGAIGESTLRIDRAGQDSVVVPVGGLIGCT